MVACVGVLEIIVLSQVAHLDTANGTSGTLLREVMSGEYPVIVGWPLFAKFGTSRFLKKGGGVTSEQIQAGAESSIHCYWVGFGHTCSI